ncbi:hypothetical protein GALL_499610 [mine drainage metagenome]|uniref:DUF5640 domain-containing protein n=1 Tax=mine drainage metagenome TaxID=410659 RepID=A0A1J5PAW1_9ZZZZ
MKKTAFILMHLACAFVLISGACKSPSNNKLKGNWHSTDGSQKLNITDKTFAIDGEEAEDYFVKGDTVFTSYQGNLPYTTYLIQKLDDHSLKLMLPDSVAVEYNS